MSSDAETAMWRERRQREREEWVEPCLRGWGLVWFSAGGSDSEKRDLEREMGRGKAKGREGQRWAVEPLGDLQETAGSCAEWGERVDRVGPWQWVAGGHLEVY